MAEFNINEILGLNKFNSDLDKSIEKFEQFNLKINETLSKLNKSKGFKNLADAQKESTDATKEQEKELKKLDKSIVEVTNTLTEEDKIQKQLTNTQDKLTQADSEANKELIKAKLNLSEKNKSIKETIKAEKEAKKGTESYIKILNTEAKTLNQAKKQNKELRGAIQDLDVTTDKGRKTVDSYNKKIDENTNFMSENSDKFVENKINVGGYKDSITEALGEMGPFGKVLGGFREKMDNFVPSSKRATEGLNGTAKGAKVANSGFKSFFKVLLANPIGLIVAGFALLIGFLMKFQPIANLVSDSFSAMSAVLDVLIARMTAFFTSIAKIFSGDFSGAMAGMKDAFSGIGDEVAETAKETFKLSKALRQLKKDEITTDTEIKRLENKRQLLQDIMDDDTLGFKTRMKAGKEAMILDKQSAKLQFDIGKRRYDAEMIAINQIKKNRKTANEEMTNDELQREADVKQNWNAIQTEYTATTRDFTEKKRRLVRDLYEQELDFLVDGYDKYKTVQEKKLKLEKTGYEESKTIIEDIREKGRVSYDDQIKVIEALALKKIDVNKLVGISDSKLLKEQIMNLDISEIAGKRLFEVVMERQILEQDYIENNIDLEKKKIDLKVQGAEKEFVNFKNDLTNKNEALKEQSEIETMILQEKLKNGEITIEEYGIREQEIVLELAKETTEQLIANLEDELLNTELSVLQKEDLAQQLHDAKIKLSNDETANYIKNNEDKEKDDQSFLEKYKEKINESLATTQDVSNQLFDISSNLNQAKINGIDAEMQKYLEKIDAGEDLSEEEQKQYQNLQIEKAKINQKQAKADKAQAIIDVTISGIMAGIKAFSSLGPIAGGIAAVLIAGITLSSIAEIKSKPLPAIPQFATGTQNAPKGMAIVGEDGYEMVQSKDGTFLTPNTASYLALKGGEIITPHLETKRILKEKGVQNINVKLPKQTFKTIDKNGVKVVIKQGSNITTRMIKYNLAV